MHIENSSIGVGLRLGLVLRSGLELDRDTRWLARIRDIYMARTRDSGKGREGA